MKPETLHTKIFLDGGIPDETKTVLSTLGFLDGQTTNPSLIVKHPRFQVVALEARKMSDADAWQLYREIVGEIAVLVPNGSVSIEVYADHTTTSEEMIAKGLILNEWIPNAHIKLPITHAGLASAEALTAKGVRVNMTLCFTQAQAGAVYSATKGAKKGDVFVSPFVGRLDDRGVDGMSLIANILRMFASSDGHVETLVASTRKLAHVYESLRLGADIITAPATLLTAWAEEGMRVPSGEEVYDGGALTPVPYEELDLTKHWSEFDISHELTDKGIDRFVADWTALVDITK